MNQKFMLLVTPEQKTLLEGDNRLQGARVTLSPIPESTNELAVVYSQHANLRFELADEGFVLFPGPHDPEPIGDLHKHLAHVKAKPEHTGRELGLLLYAEHGAIFHPDV